MGKPLDFDPGTRYVYSNFGYCLLGRVIEKVTGKSYEDFVRTSILAPLKIRDMHIGKTLEDGRRKNEVKYYAKGSGASVFGGNAGKKVRFPYGAWHLEAMDSHGGWVSSAVDLVRFAAAFDDPARSPILKQATIQTMFERPKGPSAYEKNGRPKAAYYACGWLVRPVGFFGKSNNWHNGALSGTSTILVRRYDGLNWAVLFNRRGGKTGKLLSGLIDRRVHQAAAAVKTWPDSDRFGATKRPRRTKQKPK